MAFSIEKALAAKVVLLSGDEDILRARALQECIRAATLEDDFDIEFTDGGVTQPANWSASAGTSPFLSSRRCVVVRHVLRSEDQDTTGWQSLPDSAFLVLVADDESGDDSRQGRFASARTAWEKAIEKIGGYVESFKTDPKQVVECIRDEAARFGKKMSPKSAETLAEMCGGNLSRCLEEIEKVILYVGNAEQIVESDVREAAMPSREWNVYKMVDSALAGDGGEALRQLRILVGSVAKAEDAAFQRILPTVHRQLRLIWQARFILESKADPEDLPASISNKLPQNPLWSKQPPFVRSKAMRSARNTDFRRLTACMEALSDADAKLKGMLPSFSAMETLEQMLLQMIQAMRPRAA